MTRSLVRKVLLPLALGAATLLGGCYYPYGYPRYGYPGYAAGPVYGGVAVGGGYYGRGYYR